MSATALGLAAVLALAADPRCGAAPAGSEFQSRLAAIALHESGGDPLVIGVNADRARGLPAMAIRSATPQEAAAQAAALIAQGRSVDLGLMQINSGQLAGHGLTIETAFDACRNMAAGADHYAADVQAVWSLAHRRYNTGSTERGADYAAGVEQVLNRVRTQQGTLPASAIQLAADGSAPLLLAKPEEAAVPVPRRPTPRLEDALHATSPVSDEADKDDLGDALHHPNQEVKK